MGPPTQAIVLSIDEKSQIQALDRSQPPLPFHWPRQRNLVWGFFCQAVIF